MPAIAIPPGRPAAKDKLVDVSVLSFTSFLAIAFISSLLHPAAAGPSFRIFSLKSLSALFYVREK